MCEHKDVHTFKNTQPSATTSWTPRSRDCQTVALRGMCKKKCSGKVLSTDTKGEPSSVFQGSDLEEQAFVSLETVMLSLRKGSCSEMQVRDPEERKE